VQAPLLRPRALVIHCLGAEPSLHVLDTRHVNECRPGACG
jgi:hypothetical protein